MVKLRNILSTICLCPLILANFAYGDEVTTDQRFWYIGSEIGIVEPVIKKFRHTKSNSDFILKRSEMYSGKIGYSYYPQMAIEFSATHQPKYRLHYILPEIDTGLGVTIPKTLGATKVISDIYMINLVYDLEKIHNVTPFVILGAGIAQVKVKPTSSRFDLMDIEYFKLKSSRTNCFAWQIGLGFSKDLSPNFSIDLAAKLQVAHSIKIKYDTFDMTTQQFLPASPIKKTIGVGEFGIGFTYRLPI
jgi:hypothetical protein